MVSSTTTDGAAKVYTCPTCSRQFNKKANLKVHSRKHTGEKPYACSRPGCERRFMWKSSVSFHEQNCLAGSRDVNGSAGFASIPKRHKMIHGTREEPFIPTTPTTPLESPPRPHVVNVQNPAFVPVDAMTAFSAQQDFKSVELLRQAAQSASNLSQQQQYLRLASASLQTQQHLAMSRQSTGLPMYNFGHHPPATYAETKPVNASVRSAPVGAVQSTAMFSALTNVEPAAELGQKPPPYGVTAPSVSSNGASAPAVSQQAASLPPSHPTEANPLPAPSTILEKPLRSGGRPPVIPPSLPKPPLAPNKSLGSGEQAATATKSEPALMASAAKPPVMRGSTTMKMPISMELDESDDEGADRIIGAQENFMRTGNIFTGFAPPPRCSPLPASSPIVGPGISPMPLSPLAPFSPLPPDSPAHRAPNPVHPPLNHSERPANTNF